MEEKEIEINSKKINVVFGMPEGYMEDNNLKIFLDDTIDIGEVVSQIGSYEVETGTNEMNICE